MKILAIETSCDDTSVAIVENGNHVLSSVVSSQTEIHTKFGGVVPEVAAREHVKNMIPVLEKALTKAKTKTEEIETIAVTAGPGLIGSLIVGVNTARTLALLYNKPLVAIHHIEGHIYANWLEDNLEGGQSPPEFPLVCLTVSGGHSNIIYMKSHLNYRIIGETHDDSAGEAFDKVAKMLSLGYPGGPIISKSAIKGNKNKFNFPRVDLTPMPQRNEHGFMEKPEESLDFSFSGLKTAVLREVKRLENNNALTKANISDVSASFQACANEILVRNTIRGAKKYQVKTILLSGGVAANKQLREMLTKSVLELKDTNFFYPEFKYCTDNAAMIGVAAYYHAKKNDFTEPKTLTPDSGLKLISHE